jgi:hypothetical protein
MTDFEIYAALARLDQQKGLAKMNRKKRYYRSKLDLYQGELLQLHRAGATTAELQRWLQGKRIHVVWTTVDRWVKKHG